MTLQNEDPTTVGIVVGLGNPGKRYEKTRHNVGFMVVDELGCRFSAPFQERLFRGSWGTASIGGLKVLLFKPSTFMNRSGEAVVEVLRYFRLEAAQMLVVHDDLDLPCGRARLVRRGGAGGHKGVQSIIQHVGLQTFPRLKLGIGRPVHGESVEDFVLDAPYRVEQSEFDQMIHSGAGIVEAVVAEGLSAAMNRYNLKSAGRSLEDAGS
ncbi:MAG: aminoacyl-tRNA hydrolase [Syntrophobacteraceae bacterium]